MTATRAAARTGRTACSVTVHVMKTTSTTSTAGAESEHALDEVQRVLLVGERVHEVQLVVAPRTSR